MKNLIYFLLISTVVFSQPVLSSEQQRIEKVIYAYGKAMNASDLDAVMALYAKDSVFMPSKQPTSVGWNAVKKAYKHEFEVIDLNVKIVIDEVFQENNLAYVRSRSLGHLTLLATQKKKTTERYRAFFVLKKIDNDWKIARFLFNFSN